MLIDERESPELRPETSSLDRLLGEGEDMKDREKW